MNVNINKEQDGVQHQTVNFADQTQQWVYSVDNQLDSVHHSVDTNDADLNNFFSRPIKISSINWPVGSTFQTTINPWSLYFENPRVINRISNYNLLRSKLCVRIMINGNGFHYGRALASYRPLHTDDEMIPWRMGIVNQDIIGASQRMHAWIDPTKSQGGTLCLPYVFQKNAMNIPEMDWRLMGELDIANVTTLKHANGGTDSVTISVFAWAEDVQLSIPTLAEPGAILPQSALEPQANEADVASKGPISGPADAAAKVAGSLTKVPAIGKMALATEMAASATATVARAFGMSRPVDTGPVQSYKPTYSGNMTNTNTLDTSTKLTYDVKQELTIDPSATGLGPSDEMAISSIVTRESYLTQFSWATTNPPESLLWNTYVTPLMYDVFPVSPEEEYHATPMAYATLPFHNWRGTIKFRFQIVASAFHKGRIKVVYDPYFAAAGASEYNVQYTQIIDLADARDFEVEVKWGQERSYLVNPGLSPGVAFSTSPLSVDQHAFTNGMLSVFVVNDLTTPSATLDDVAILVSTKAGDDFEVINPTLGVTNVTFWQPQAGFRSFMSALVGAFVMPTIFDKALAAEAHQSKGKMSSKSSSNFTSKSSRNTTVECLEEHSSMADGDNTLEESAPVTGVTENALGTIVPTASDDAHKVYFGDPVTSIRQILKRYEHYHVWTDMNGEDPVNTARMVYYTLPDFPIYRGYAPAAEAVSFSQSPVDPTPYNYTQPTLMNYFTPLFLCRRGSIRHKFIYTLDARTQTCCGVLSAERLASPNGYGKQRFASSSDVSQSAQTYVAMNRGLSGHAGMACTPIANNSVLEVELPFFSELRFFPARTKGFNGANSLKNKFHSLTFPVMPAYNDAVYGAAAVLDYVAAGEDFSLSFFQACPVFWVQGVPDPSLTN